MSMLAGIVVAAFALFLIGLGGLVFARPALAERFLMTFASSAMTHYTEQIFRLIVGTALVLRAPSMWQAGLFGILGWLVVVTSVGLVLVPWQWHHRFGERVLPILVQHMRLYALGLLGFGALLLYGLLGSPS